MLPSEILASGCNLFSLPLASRLLAARGMCVTIGKKDFNKRFLNSFREFERGCRGIPLIAWMIDEEEGEFREIRNDCHLSCVRVKGRVVAINSYWSSKRFERLPS